MEKKHCFVCQVRAHDYLRCWHCVKKEMSDEEFGDYCEKVIDYKIKFEPLLRSLQPIYCEADYQWRTCTVRTIRNNTTDIEFDIAICTY